MARRIARLPLLAVKRHITDALVMGNVLSFVQVTLAEITLMKMSRYFAALTVLLSLSANVMAAEQTISPEKRAAIEQLLQTTGALQIGQQLSAAMITQFSSALRASHADIPQKALDVLPEVVNSVIGANIATLRETVVQIYDAHLTLEDVKGLNQFYATDLGRKVIKSLPAVLQESIVAGQKWGQALGPEIVQQLQARFRKEGIAL
jgi:uncharacterized protein